MSKSLDMAPYTTTSTTTYGSTSGSNGWSSYTPFYVFDQEWKYEVETDSFRNTVTGDRISYEQVVIFGGIIKAATKLGIAKDKKLLDDVFKKVNSKPQFNEVRQNNIIDYEEALK